MTNEEIIENVPTFRAFELNDTNLVMRIEALPLFLNLARADEREKMQGVEVWVSWDGADKVISTEKPENYEQDGETYYCNYGYVIERNVKDFATHLGVSQGQCKKFRIVEYVK